MFYELNVGYKRFVKMFVCTENQSQILDLKIS